MKSLTRVLFAALFAVTTLSAQQGTTVGSPTANAGGAPSAGPGSGSVTSVSVVNTPTVTGTVANPTTTPAITLTAISNPSPTGNNLLSGGGVDFVSNLTLTVGAATYTIAGTQYTSPITTLTAATADPTFDRIDIVAVNSSGAAVLIQGTPSATPVAPDVDPTTQLQLTFYILPAGSTVIPVTKVLIYDENVGPAAEWTATKAGAPINLGSTNNPYTGTKDIEGTSAVSGNTFTFTAGSDFDPAASNSVLFYCAPKASWPNAKQFSVRLLNSSGTPIGTTVTFKSGTFNFNSAATANAYQQVAIPTSLFGANGQNARAIKFTLSGGGAAIGFYFDTFSLQSGLAPPTVLAAMNWKGPYSATTAYAPQDTVLSAGLQYVSIAAGTGHTPASSPTFWQPSTASTGGTLTTVTSTPAQGVTLNITNPTTTPNITPALGDITPTSVTTTGINSATGANVTVGTPISLTANAGTVDVTKGFSTVSNNADTTLAYSGTPTNNNQWFTYEVTNSDTVSHVWTIPSTFDTGTQALTTTFTVLAGGTETITTRWNGSRYLGYGIPSAGYSAEISVASATTTNIGATASINVSISGTTTITGLGTVAAGTYRQGRFTGILTFTHNASSLILPNAGSNITTAANDRFGAYSLGSGNWLVLWYQRANGQALAGSGSASPLTTKGDVYTFSTVDARLAIGSNGSIFMADSAATTGNKWTTPTYPNTATSRKLLIGDGTNIVQSTETWAVPGTSGNYLKSDGTNWTSAALSAVTSVGLTMPPGYSVASSPVTSSGTIAVTDTATQTISASAIDWATGKVFSKTLGANTTFTFSNTTDGQTIVVALTNTASNWTVTWPTVSWTASVPPVQTIGAKTDVYTFIKIGSTFFGSYVQNLTP